MAAAWARIYVDFMSQPRNRNDPDSANVFKFNWTGLMVFCLCLIAGTSFLTGQLVAFRQVPAPEPVRNIPGPGEQDKYTFTRQGPWGELLTQEISLERPVEYLIDEMKTVPPPVWTFSGMSVAEVRAFFITNGLPEQQADKALTPDRVSIQGTTTVFKPSEEFLFSLGSETRARLYQPMRGLNVNDYLEWPWYFPRDGIEAVFRDARLHPDDLACFKQLVYGCQDACRLADFETLMGKIPTLERRVAMAASLSRQYAVLVRLCIRPDTDLDSLGAYWGKVPNVHFTGVRPMLQALKGLPKGGSIDLEFLLPPFARNHLYTYQLPPAPGEPIKNCYWSTFNFCSVKPDDRFSSLAECGRYIEQEFYRIPQPGAYGDVLLFMNDMAQIGHSAFYQAQVGHSAVYLADDLVFTKNGNNYAMPWIIMRITDLHAMYPDLQIAYMRKKPA